MDVPLALQPADEPRIESFTDTGEEITDSNITQYKRFLARWKEIGADPDRLEVKEEDDANEAQKAAFKYIQLIRTVDEVDLLMLREVLASLAAKGSPLEMQRTGYFYDDNGEPDVARGMAVIDKQLQLQTTSKFFLSSIDTLKEAVATFARKLQQVEVISKRLEFSMSTDLLSGRVLPVLRVACLSPVKVVLDHDKSGNIVWQIDRKTFFNLNGVTICGHDLRSVYSRMLTRVALCALFRSMTSDVVKGSCMYGVTGVSKKLEVVAGGTKLLFSETDAPSDTQSLCPVFIPAMAEMMLTVNTHPYNKLVRCLESLNRIKTLSDIVINRFISCDFVEVLFDRKGHSAAIHLSPVYSFEADIGDSTTKDKLKVPPAECVTVVISEKSVVATRVSSPFNIEVIDVSRGNKELDAWCFEQYWTMFQYMVYHTACRFGFEVQRTEKLKFVVICEGNRKVEFRMGTDAEIVVLISENENSFYLRWQSLPLTRSEDRLSYLFFASIFR